MRPLTRRTILAAAVAVPVALAVKAAPARQLRPFVVGRMLNIEPMPLMPFIWQVHVGPVDEISAVHGRGIGFGYAGDFPTLAALSDSFHKLDVDCYATCLREGVFMLGSLPGFPILADVTAQRRATFGRYYPPGSA